MTIANQLGAGLPTWPRTDLGPLIDGLRPFAVVIDAAGTLDAGDLAEFGDVVGAADWFELRRVYEARGRDARPGDARVVVHLVSGDFGEARDLPWDIEQASSVAIVRLPFDREWLPIWRSLGGEQRAELVAVLMKGDPVDLSGLLVELFGIVLPQVDEARELEEVVRLRARAAVPAAMWPRISRLVRGDLAGALCAEPADRSTVQAAWDDWMAHGAASRRAPLFDAVGPAVLELHRAGLVTASPRVADGIPSWADPGAQGAQPIEIARALLGAPVQPWPPASIDDWFAAAAWWGDLRAALAIGAPVPTNVRDAALERWSQLDAAFGPWIRTQLPELLDRPRSWPTTVDQIAPFLARRLRNGTDRVLLVVIDGMAHAQWSLIREQCALRVEQAGSSAALIPTLTEHSRQAIFAGARPVEFADTLTWERLWRTEEARWRAFWENEGIGPVRYLHVGGATADDVPNFGSERVVGVAVLAVDELLHSAELLGDAQVAAGLRTWSAHGFLSELVERATRAGFETWITADHGNIEAVPAGKIVHEGLEVDRAGLRVRHYATRAQRDGARAQGIAWDPPWLPGAPAYLFASGRTAYLPAYVSAQVVHGGMSLDEVIVPLMRVTR